MTGIEPGCARWHDNEQGTNCNRRDVAGSSYKCLCGRWIDSTAVVIEYPWRVA